MNRSTISKVVVACAITIYALLLGTISYLKYSYYGFSDFDLAIHAQSTRNIIHGSLDSSILGIPFLGNHMVLILFVLAPFYALFPTPLLLLFTQTIVLALGGLGIYLLARKELSETWATCLTIVYLAYPPLIYMNLYEFHPIALASAFMVFMLFFYRTEQFKWFAVFMTLTLLCQENCSLIIGGFGVYAMIDGRRGRWAWVPLLCGIVYLVVSTMIVMPRLNNNTVQFWQIYAHLGNSPANIISNIVCHPLNTLTIMTTPDKTSFICALLGPLGFLSLLDPLTLLPAAPVLLQRLLSDRFTETKIIFHYQAEFIPFIFASAIMGIKRIQGWHFRVARIMPVIILIIFPAAALISSDLPAIIRSILTMPDDSPALNRARNAMLSTITANAPVVATFQFLPKLTNREKLYSLHHIYTGYHTLSTAPYHTPKDIRYVVIDTFDPLTFQAGGFHGPEQFKKLQAIFAEGTWNIIANRESMFVMERTAASPNQMPKTVSLVDVGITMNTNVVQTGPESLKLAGFNIDSHHKDNTARITLYWTKTANDPREYNIEIALVRMEILYRGKLAPGNRVWPTQSWQVSTNASTLIADEHWIETASALPSSDTIQLHAVISPVN